MVYSTTVSHGKTKIKQLPPIRISEQTEEDFGIRINKIIERASKATGQGFTGQFDTSLRSWSMTHGCCPFNPEIGLEVTDISNEEIRAIKAEADNATQNTEYMMNTTYDRSDNADGDVIGQNQKYLGPKSSEEFIGDRRGHTINTEKVIKGSKYSNLPVRKEF